MGNIAINEEDIKYLCYELYKIDWLEANVNSNQQRAEYRKYFLTKISSEEKYNDENYTFEKHLELYGYNTKMYLSYEEFCKTAFINTEYINYLLGDKAVYRHEQLRKIWEKYLDTQIVKG